MRSTCLSLLGHEAPLQVTLAALFFGLFLWCLPFRNTFFLKISLLFQWQGQVFEVQLVSAAVVESPV